MIRRQGGPRFAGTRTGAVGLALLFLLAAGCEESPLVPGATPWDDAPVFQFAFGGWPADVLSDPESVVADPAGNVYVVENQRIVKFDAAGGYVAAWDLASSTAGIVAPSSRLARGGYATSPRSPVIPPGTNFTRHPPLCFSRGRVFAGYRDVVRRFSPDGILEASWGGRGTADGEFGYLRELGADAEGNIYALDEENRRVQKFSPEGMFLLSWGRQGTHDGEFEEPSGMAVDPRGYVYVSDSDLGRISRFTLDGTLLGSWIPPADDTSHVMVPSRLAVDPDGNVSALVYDFANVWRTQKFSPEGTLLSQWFLRVPEDAYVHRLDALAFDPAGNVLIVDASSNRVRRCASDGRILETLGRTRDEVHGAVTNPVRVSVAPDGTICVYSDGTDELAAFSPGGVLLRTYDLLASDFRYPRAMTHLPSGDLLVTDGLVVLVFDPEGRLADRWTVDYGGRREVTLRDVAADRSGRVVVLLETEVQVYTSHGERLRTFPVVRDSDPASTEFHALAIGPGSSVYTGSASPRLVRRFSLDGELLAEYPFRPTGLGRVNAVTDIAVDSSGNLYILDGSAHRIHQFTLTGDFITRWGSEGRDAGAFVYPRDLVLDGRGGFYVADWDGDRVIKFARQGDSLSEPLPLLEIRQ